MAGFFTLVPGDGPRRWRLAIDPWLTVGPPETSFMFGGVGLGATVEAAERTTGRAVVWASAQYLAYAPRGTEVEFHVVPMVEGHYTSQAQVMAEGRDGQVLRAGLSLGARPDAPRVQFVKPARVPRPEDCPRMPLRWGYAPDDMYSRLDVRIAKGWDAAVEEAGQLVFWIRPAGAAADAAIDRPMLAIMADFVPASIGNALSDGTADFGANSLDNGIRFLQIVPTGWVQCEIRVHGAADGFGHGEMLLFAEDGTLMATASQSVILRGLMHPRDPRGR